MLTALRHVDELMPSRRAEGPFDMITALSRAEGLRCAASIVTETYCKYASFIKICAP